MPQLFINPFHLLLPPTILALSLPLALFAVFTTTIACIALTIRVSIVYFDLGLAILRSWLLSLTRTALPTTSTHRTNNNSNQRGKTPQAHTPPSGNATPTTATSQLGHVRHRSSKSLASSIASDSYTSLLLTAAPVDRDYEGLGGWRPLDEADEADAEHDPWTSINARLELPTAVSAPSLAHANANAGVGAGAGTANASANAVQGRTRRHVRSLTGASASGLKMSPVLARSPAASMVRDAEGAGYFGTVYGSSASSLVRRSSVGLVMSGFERNRPKSLHGDG